MKYILQAKPRKMLRNRRSTLLLFNLIFGMVFSSTFSSGQEINEEGWPVPDLKGLIPYTMSVKLVDGVEKVVEKFLTPRGGHVARLSGNGKVFAYAVDSDQEPPIDYLLLDLTGFGKFTHKLKADDAFTLPEWISR